MMLVFDLGGTHMRLALYENGKLSDILRAPTDRSAAGFAKFLGALEEVSSGQRVKAVAGGLPGQISGERGELVVAPNLPEWIGMPVVERIGELLGCPVFVTNDVELGGLGEARFGAGSTTGVMAYYTVSTGVNAVRLVDGEVDRTVPRYEVGKQVINYAGGNPRTLESLTGGAALQKKHGLAPGEIKDPQIWVDEARFLAGGIYNTALHWGPEVVVIGGSMTKDIDLKLVADGMVELPNVLVQLPRLVRAKLGDLGGLHGATAWLEELGYAHG